MTPTPRQNDPLALPEPTPEIVDSLMREIGSFLSVADDIAEGEAAARRAARADLAWVSRVDAYLEVGRDRDN